MGYFVNYQTLGKVFPTKSSFVIFCLYVLLFSNHGILVASTQTDNKSYEYNVVTVVLLTELLKLIASIVLYCKDNKITNLVKDVSKERRVCYLYLIPALLYCFYNNLSFHNLLVFDPTTYNILLQFRIFITAILFQFIFRRSLSGKQWISLLILTIGCVLKQIDFGGHSETDETYNKYAGFDLFHFSTLSLLLQMTCSCLAGVYNEYLLKNEGADVNIYVQNVFMYVDSIICNAIVLLFQGELLTAFTAENLAKVTQFKVMLMMVNNAVVGIITSFFLKQLNSILKTYASALEVVIIAILSYYILDIPIYLNTVLSICTVLIAVYIYTKNPVKGPEVQQHSEKADDEELLMSEVLVKD